MRPGGSYAQASSHEPMLRARLRYVTRGGEPEGAAIAAERDQKLVFPTPRHTERRAGRALLVPQAIGQASGYEKAC